MQRSTLLNIVVLCMGLLATNLPVQAQNQAAVSAALRYVQDNAAALGLTAADVADVAVADAYTSKHNGVTHVYLNQRYRGIDVHNALINVNVSREGTVLNAGNRFVAGLAGRVTGAAGLSAGGAVQAAAMHLGLRITEPLDVLETKPGAAQAARLSGGGVALESIPARLVYQPLPSGEVRLAWNVGLYTTDALHYWNMRVDAASGALLAQDDLVAHDHWGTPDAAQAAAAPAFPAFNSAGFALFNPDSYNVFPLPAESPLHPAGTGTPQSPVPSPANGTASPFGWHDTNGSTGAEFTDTRGNNVDAYADRDGNNIPDSGSRPSGGSSLDFNYPIDLSQQPSAYVPGAVTNLFYWNNIIHDVTYQYGFDEAGGNFQVNNYGKGGLGGDDVRAEAQDGGGNCNANFLTPSDGSRPRMQMYTCNNTTPERDGDLDAGVIVHEYGHGISNRLTGGPGTSSCLNNAEQMGEGWSDYFALMLTQQPGDIGAQARGIGTYLFGQDPTGPGIRARPYSTSFGVNEFTYNNIKTASIPHGVGHVWATMLWDLNWALIGNLFPDLGGGDDGAGGGSGSDPDLYNGNGGNNLALQLVTDGMKLQPCGPGFVDGRDAIILADDILTGDGNPATHDGKNLEIIWNVFARRGLGWSASQGSSNSALDGTQAFDLPPFLLDPTDVHVENIVTGTQNQGGGNKKGTATVTIYDDVGNPAAGYTVTGDFTGDINQTGVSGVTDGSGQVILVTSEGKKGGVNVSFCVNNVSKANGLPYDPNDNASPAYACNGGGGGTPTTMHVESIVTGTLGVGGGDKKGTATVTIFDDTGSQAGAGYTVTGNFTGDIEQTGVSGVTDGTGQVTLVTNGTAKGKVSVSFCVSSVTGGVLPYEPNDNTPGTTCTSAAKGLSAAGETPQAFGLAQNYPNPFNPSSEIGFQVPEAVHVRLVVFDLLGREVARLVDEAKPAGAYRVTFDAATLPSGTYVYRMTAGSFVETRRMVLLK